MMSNSEVYNNVQQVDGNKGQLWKWAVFFYCQALMMECIIVPVFWIIIKPKMPPPPNWMDYVSQYYDHVSILLLLLIDFVFNSIVFPTQ
jgi:hypothetical protein